MGDKAWPSGANRPEPAVTALRPLHRDRPEPTPVLRPALPHDLHPAADGLHLLPTHGHPLPASPQPAGPAQRSRLAGLRPGQPAARTGECGRPAAHGRTLCVLPPAALVHPRVDTELRARGSPAPLGRARGRVCFTKFCEVRRGRQASPRSGRWSELSGLGAVSVAVARRPW